MIRQFEIRKCKPPGVAKEHWFVIISGNERCASERQTAVNGLICFTLREALAKTDVMLNGADGFETETACVCDFLYYLPKASLQPPIGVVGFERQRQIKARLREVLRLN